MKSFKPARTKQQAIVHQRDEYVQSGLIARGPRLNAGNPWPPLYSDINNFRRILNDDGPLGVDFEFGDNNKATVVGIANEREGAALFYAPDLMPEILHASRTRGRKLVGHSVIGAEMKVFKREGLETSIGEWVDTMGLHYLANMDLVKAPDKDEDEGGAMGFMNLWTMSSLYLPYPRWKECRGRGCDELVCPRHDVLAYCAMDALASVAAYPHLDAELRRFNVADWKRDEWLEATFVAQQMQDRGVKVDMDYVRTLEKHSEELKETLFPFETQGKKRVYELFNPRAGEQVSAWFRERGLILDNTRKETIRKQLEHSAKNAGYALVDEDGKFTTAPLEQAEDALPPVLETLWKVYEYKGYGKGLDPWFADKYRDKDDIIHSRFNTVGASTERWSSSAPNFQNIPARGFGALVRAAVIPRSSDLQLLKADFSQLELRMCLWLAGIDPAGIGKDAFTWLVMESKGAFDQAAAIADSEARQIAKSVSHGGDYLEGIQIINPADLDKPNIKAEIAAGARRVYLKKHMPRLKRDWLFRGGIVTFTGANLAERLFGDRTRANRAKALQIQEDIYFANFFAIREWQMKVLDFVESHGYVQSPTGSFLRLVGSREDDAKMAVAKLGQGTAAEHVVGMLLRFYRETASVPVLMVHDELVFEIPRGWSDRQAADFIALMGEETHRLAGFKSAFKAIRGNAWLEGGKKTPAHLTERALWPLNL